MLSSFFVTIDSRTATLVFPSSQELWTFFALAETKMFRIDSTNCVFTGRLQRSDIELAKRKLGASEL
jgi:hypothetical protein